jgi:hypothetical protein
MSKVRPLYEPEYVIPCVTNLTEEKAYLNVYLNFPPVDEYPKYVENRI